MFNITGLPLAEDSNYRAGDHIYRLTKAQSSDRYPTIAIDGEDQIVTLWESYEKDKGECILLRFFDGKIWSEEAKVSTDGLAYRPVATTDSKGRVHAVWAEFSKGKWHIYWSMVEKGMVSQGRFITDSGADYFPHIASGADGQVWVVWSSFREGNHDVFGRVFDGVNWGEEFRITQHGSSFRPHVILDANNGVWVGFDRFDQELKQYNTYVVTIDGPEGDISPVVMLSQASTIWNSDISLAVDGKGKLWAAWQGIGTKGYTADYVSFLDDTGWTRPRRIGARQTLFSHCRIDTDIAGEVWLTSTISRSAIETRKLTTDGWSVGYKVSQSELNKHPQVVAYAGGFLFVWQRSPLNGKVDSRNGDIHLRWLDTNQAQGELVLGMSESDVLEESDYAIGVQKYNSPEMTERKGIQKYKVYWGDPHGQTNVSDGLGYPDQFYNYLIHISRMDFGAITDHSEYPDMLSDADWAYIKETNRLFNKPGEFVTMHAYEWSSNEWKIDYGHANIYYPQDDPPLFRSCDPESEHPQGLFDSVRPYGAVVIPHHVAANWGRVGASYDWDHFDSELQPIVEICSNHGIFEFTGNPRAHKFESQGNHVQDALARGYKLGIIGGSDSHGLQPGDDSGIAAVLVEGELTREKIFDAWRNRRCYGSTAPRFAIDFTINGTIMGKTLSVKNGEPIEIAGTVKSFQDISQVDLVKNNQNIASFQPVKVGIDPVWNFAYTDVGGGLEQSYYYLRVTLLDGETMWTSPIWVNNG